ncbi:MAG: hypothetical protein AABY53_05225 [Bdellovibrionota bacterium]
MKQRHFYIYFKTLFFCAFAFFIAACSPLKNSKYEEYLSLKYEVPECNQTYTYSSTVTLSGTAKYFKRGVNLVTQFETENSAQVLKLKNMTQGDPLKDALPIKFAEVAVYSSNGQLVQCGKTDELGNLKALNTTSNLLIPATAEQYKVFVFSRMNHALSKVTVKANVKQDKYTNELHYISAIVSANGIDDPNVSLLAYARQTDSLGVEGGAFNILNNIYTSYKYLDLNTGTASLSCLSNKFDIYWKLGFNPAQYLYPDQDPASLANITFYDEKINSIFISGGKLGNISFEPARHFDDYVIIHELGHHIENVCGSLTTPGGSHSIITRVDPRIAWAEGWSNYFSAQVMYSSIASINPEFTTKMTSAGISNTAWTYLFASEGFSDSVQNIGSGSGFMFDLKKAGNNPDTWQVGSYIGQAFDKVDPARYPGEGHFREGAITRGLFKLSNVCGVSGTCITVSPISFENMWKSMDKITGIGQSTYPFKSSAAFMEKLKSLISPITWAATITAFNQAQTSEALHIYSDGIFTTALVNKWFPYGTYLTNTTSGACTLGTYRIEPRSDDPVLTGTNSDQRYSNHFYTIDFNQLNGLSEIKVDFTNITGTTTEFDILLFEEGYLFNGDYTCSNLASDGSCNTSYVPSRSTNASVVRSDRRAGNISSKVIRTLQSLDTTKRYLLNIRAYTANKSISSNTEYSYTIQNQNGANLCP